MTQPQQNAAIYLSDLYAEKDRLAKMEVGAISALNSASATLNQVRGAIMQTNALIARAEKREAQTVNSEKPEQPPEGA